MNLKTLLKEIIEINKTISFKKNRDGARKVYQLLKLNTVKLEFEQLIYENKLFSIQNSILIEDKEKAFHLFVNGLVTIIDIIKKEIDK